MSEPERRLAPGELYLVAANSYANQKENGFQQRQDRPPWPLELPLDWRADPHNDNNWNIQLHSWRMIDPILREWFREPSPRLVQEMLAFARDWHAFHCERVCENSWYDMAAGIRALRIAFFFERDRCDEGDFTDEDRQLLVSLYRQHSTYLMDDANWGTSNHALFQAMGNRVMHRQAGALADDVPYMAASGELMLKCLKSLFTDEGIEKEHSAGYHFFVTDVMDRCSIAENFPEIAEVLQIIELAKRNRAWLYFPDGTVSRVGDTLGQYDVSPAEVPAIEGARSWRSDGRELLIGDFSRSGWVIVKSAAGTPLDRQSMLFFTAMSHGYGHKQADDLSFQLFEGGRHVLVDSGQYALSPYDEMKLYVAGAASHNTVDLGDAPMSRRDTPLYGSGLNPVRADRKAIVMSGEILDRGRAFSHLRRLKYRPGRDLEVVDFLEVNNGKKAELCSRLHFAPDLEVRAETNGFSARVEGQAIARIVPPSGWSVELVFGREKPPLGWVTVGYRSVKPIFVIEARKTVATATAKWRIRFRGERLDGEEAEATPANEVVATR